MALLPSEICRLILGKREKERERESFLQEEHFDQTYHTFLNECTYLKECQIYLTRGINFSTYIHGKSLKQHLVSNFDRSFSTVSTQTDSYEANYSESAVPVLNSASYPVGDLDANMDILSLVRQQNDMEVSNEPIISTIDMHDKPTGSRRRKLLKNHRSKTLLTTPTKNEQHFVSSVATSSSPNHSSDDSSENILDLNSFIENLCSNDFPEKLAQSINQLNMKKFINVQEDDLSTNASQITLTETQAPAIEKKTIESATEALNTTSNDLLIEMTGTISNEKLVIDNSDIIQLAEQFSEPIFSRLFEEINFDQLLDDDHGIQSSYTTFEHNDKTTSESCKPIDHKIPEKEPNKLENESNIKTSPTLLNRDQDRMAASIREKNKKINKLPVCYTNKKKTSAIMIGRTLRDIEQLEKEFCDTNSAKRANENPTPDTCVSETEPTTEVQDHENEKENEERKEKDNQDDTDDCCFKLDTSLAEEQVKSNETSIISEPKKRETMSKSPSPRRSKTIKQILELTNESTTSEKISSLPITPAKIVDSSVSNPKINSNTPSKSISIEETIQTDYNNDKHLTNCNGSTSSTNKTNQTSSDSINSNVMKSKRKLDSIKNEAQANDKSVSNPKRSKYFGDIFSKVKENSSIQPSKKVRFHTANQKLDMEYKFTFKSGNNQEKQAQVSDSHEKRDSSLHQLTANNDNVNTSDDDEDSSGLPQTQIFQFARLAQQKYKQRLKSHKS